MNDSEATLAGRERTAVPADVTSAVDHLQVLLRNQLTLSAKLECIAELVERTVPACDAASVALVVASEATTAGASGPLAIEADLVQYRNREGPCLDAADRGRTVRVDVLEADERFRHFAAGAVERGVASVLSVALHDGDDVVGSINLYSVSPGAFDDRTEAAIRPLADHAAQLISSSPLYVASIELLDRLHALMADNDVMAMATGFLMTRDHVTADDARAELGRRATRNRTSAAEEARAVAAGATRGDHTDGAEDPGS